MPPASAPGPAPTFLTVHPVGYLLFERASEDMDSLQLYHPLYLGLNVVGRYAPGAPLSKSTPSIHTCPSITHSPSLSIPTHHVKIPVELLAPAQFAVLIEPVPVSQYLRTRSTPLPKEHSAPHSIQYLNETVFLKVTVQAIPSSHSNITNDTFFIPAHNPSGLPHRLTTEQVELLAGDMLQVGAECFFEVTFFDFHHQNPFETHLSPAQAMSPDPLPKVHQSDDMMGNNATLHALASQLTTQPPPFTLDYYSTLTQIHKSQQTRDPALDRLEALITDLQQRHSGLANQLQHVSDSMSQLPASLMQTQSIGQLQPPSRIPRRTDLHGEGVTSDDEGEHNGALQGRRSSLDNSFSFDSLPQDEVVPKSTSTSRKQTGPAGKSESKAAQKQQTTQLTSQGQSLGDNFDQFDHDDHDDDFPPPRATKTEQKPTVTSTSTTTTTTATIKQPTTMGDDSFDAFGFSDDHPSDLTPAVQPTSQTQTSKPTSQRAVSQSNQASAIVGQSHDDMGDFDNTFGVSQGMVDNMQGLTNSQALRVGSSVPPREEFASFEAESQQANAPTRKLRTASQTAAGGDAAAAAASKPVKAELPPDDDHDEFGFDSDHNEEAQDDVVPTKPVQKEQQGKGNRTTDLGTSSEAEIFRDSDAILNDDGDHDAHDHDHGKQNTTHTESEAELPPPKPRAARSVEQFAGLATMPLPDEVISSSYDSDEDEEEVEYKLKNVRSVSLRLPDDQDAQDGDNGDKDENDHDDEEEEEAKDQSAITTASKSQQKSVKKQRTQAGDKQDEDAEVKLATPIKLAPLATKTSSQRVTSTTSSNENNARPVNKRLRRNDTNISMDSGEDDSLEAQALPVMATAASRSVGRTGSTHSTTNSALSQHSESGAPAPTSVPGSSMKVKPGAGASITNPSGSSFGNLTFHGNSKKPNNAGGAGILQALARAGSVADLDDMFKDELLGASSYEASTLSYLTESPGKGMKHGKGGAKDKTPKKFAKTYESSQDGVDSQVSPNTMGDGTSEDDSSSQVPTRGRRQRGRTQDTDMVDDDDGGAKKPPSQEAPAPPVKKGGRTAASARRAVVIVDDKEDDEEEEEAAAKTKKAAQSTRVRRSLTTMSTRPTYGEELVESSCDDSDDDAASNETDTAAQIKALLGPCSSFPIIMCTGLQQKYNQAQLDSLVGCCMVVNDVNPTQFTYNLQLPHSALNDNTESHPFAPTDTIPSVLLQSTPLLPTHLISSSYQRTAKLLVSFSCTPWILSEQWLIDSIKDGQWKHEREYVLEADQFTKQYDFDLEAARDSDRFSRASYNPHTIFLKLNAPVLLRFKEALQAVYEKFYKIHPDQRRAGGKSAKLPKLSKAQTDTLGSELDELQNTYVNQMIPIQQPDFASGALKNTIVIYSSNVVGPKLHEIQSIVQSAQGILLPLPAAAEKGVEQMGEEAFLASPYANYNPSLLSPLLPLIAPSGDNGDTKKKTAGKRGAAAKGDAQNDNVVDTSAESPQISLLRLALFLFTNHFTLYHHTNPTFPSTTSKKSPKALSTLTAYPPLSLVPCQFSTLFTHLIAQQLCSKTTKKDDDHDDELDMEGLIPKHLAPALRSELNSLTQSEVTAHATRKYAQYLASYAEFYTESVKLGNIASAPASVKDLGKKMGQTVPSLQDWQMYNKLFTQLHQTSANKAGKAAADDDEASDNFKIILITNENQLQEEFPQLLSWAFTHKIPIYTKDALLNTILNQKQVFDKYQLTITKKRGAGGEFNIKAP